MDFERQLAEIRKTNEEALKAFKTWIKNDSLIEEFKDIIFPGAETLVEIFKYTPPSKAKGKLVGMKGEDLVAKTRTKVYPLAKVIALGESLPVFYKNNLESGSIVTLRDDLMVLRQNANYAVYLEAMKEKPAPNLTAEQVPPKLITALETDFQRHYYERGKFQLGSSRLIYLIPPMHIVSIYKRNFKDFQ